MKKIIISAISLNNVIGIGNRIPWHNKEELKYFKETTLEAVVLMGRKTYQAIGKALPNRINLVVSKKLNENEKNLFYFQSIEDALRYAETLGIEKLFIIGGSEIYLQTIKEVDELLISRIPFEVEGDKHFPTIDSKIWELKKIKEYESFTVERYIKLV
jgi:dihydrofolate reductase